MTRYGTSHFVSKAAAIRYYRDTEGDNAREAVERKLSEGEIHIGAPDLKPGETLSVIDNGTRYEIAETNETGFLKDRLKQAIPTLTDDDFAVHATDLYVVAYPEVRAWLKANYRFWTNVTTFVSQVGSNWNGAGRVCFDIPFAEMGRSR